MTIRNKPCRFRLSGRRIILAGVASIVFPGTCYAADNLSPYLPPQIPSSDDNFVDLVSGAVTIPQNVTGVGPIASGGVEDTIFVSGTKMGSSADYIAQQVGGYYIGAGAMVKFKWFMAMSFDTQFNQFDGNTYIVGAHVSFGGKRIDFTASGGGAGSYPVFSAQQTSLGNTLVVSADGTSLTLTTRDGTTATVLMGGPQGTTVSATYAIWGAYVTSIRHPDGRVESIYYKDTYKSDGSMDVLHRLQAVKSNSGWMLKYNYDGLSGQGLMPDSISAINLANGYCDPMADSCSGQSGVVSTTLQYTYGATYNGRGANMSQFLVTGPSGDVVRYSFLYSFGPQANGISGNYGVISAVKPPSSSSDQYLFEYNPVQYNSSQDAGDMPKVKKVTKGSSVWTYTFSDDQAMPYTTVRTVVVTAPDSSTVTYTGANPSTGVARVTSVTDALSRKKVIAYDSGPTPASTFLTTSVTYPRGNKTAYTYDARGNVTSSVFSPATGSSQAALVWTANYDSTCANVLTCNKPNYEIDPNGNRTDYAYNPSNGMIDTLSYAAPTAGGVRPAKRYSYAQMSAYFKDASGAVVASGSPIWVNTAISTCMTQGSCAGTSDESLVTTDYGPQANGTPNNLLPRSSIISSGGSQRRTCFTYDSQGNQLSRTEPNAALSVCP